MKTSNLNRSLLTAAIAALAACAAKQPETAVPSGTAKAGVRCQGINACKSMGECSGAGHECGKHTPCKGQGWLTVASADECSTKGGTVL